MLALIHHNSEDAALVQFVTSEVLACFPLGDHPVPKKGSMIRERVE